jgi:DNA ligase (NAD+)
MKTRKKINKLRKEIKITRKVKQMTERLNETFIDVLEKLHSIMIKKGEVFRAAAYKKAEEALLLYPNDITNIDQVKDIKGIGKSIVDKFEEYLETGTLQIFEIEKANPANIFSDIYGIGPKKAEELVKQGFTSISELREKQNEYLNDTQKIGLKYYEQFLQRIPRKEIEQYEKIFKKYAEPNSFEIVGSYRRGQETSGDIDVIVNNNLDIVDKLVEHKIILHVLSRGPAKALVVAKLPTSKIARRVDFLFSPPSEFAFAKLYFTGSKTFNTIMRQHALNIGYTLNEHGLKTKVKGEKIDHVFKDESDIFSFLNLEYKEPEERTRGGPIPLDPVHIKINQAPSKEMHIIDSFKKHGISAIEKLDKEQLEKVIKFAQQMYYNSEPVLTDAQYDIISDYAVAAFDIVLDVGAPTEKEKAVLPFELWSMDKIKPDTNALSKWTAKYKGPYVISCKLDGVSGLYTTMGKSGPKLYTRGDGKIGQDISHLIPHMNFPTGKNIAIRGEFIISKSIFNSKYKSQFANPRNMVAGVINHKTITDPVKDLHFVAYEVIVPKLLNASDQLQYLTDVLKIETVTYERTAKLSNDLLSLKLLEWREKNPYEIDGLIVSADDKAYERTSGNPEHAFAFKMILTDQTAEVKVIDVLWSPSQYGYLKPRVRIEPIKLDGVTIEYATGFNGKFIEQNKIGIGAVIQIVRSGGVIPDIQKVIIPAETAKMPDVPYTWTDTHIDIIMDDLENNEVVLEKNITSFFKSLEVDGIGSGNVERMMEAGFNSIPKIIAMTKEDFLSVQGFKDKMATKLYTNIHVKLEDATLAKLMDASNKFGRGFSEKKIDLILSYYPDILTSSMSNSQKITSIENIKGLAQKSAIAFVSHIDDFLSFLKESKLEHKLKIITPSAGENTIIQSEHPLFKKTIVLTGTRDKEIIEYLKQVGAVQGSSVSKNTFLVIAKTKDDDTGKAEDARKLGIPIISVFEFNKLYKEN